MYRATWQRGVAVDVVKPDVDLRGYRLVMLACSSLLSARVCEAITEFVRGGGTLVAVAKLAHADD